MQGQPLAGGVSSDIWRVDLPDGPVCAKRSLAKLKVADDWFAPPERIALEREFYQFTAAFAPGMTPRVLGFDESLGILITEFLDPETHKSWKDLLKAGESRAEVVKDLGSFLREIANQSRRNETVRALFYKPSLIESLRLEPYFIATAERHADLSRQLSDLVALFTGNSTCLIHGDFSPKNILFGPGHAVVLDAECANFGDPAFDLAFCCNHLLLKSAWLPQHADKHREAFDAFVISYFDDGDDDGCEERAVHYLAGLMLARIDGKSPVEYLTDGTTRDIVRNFARSQIRSPTDRLMSIADAWYPLWSAHNATIAHS